MGVSDQSDKKPVLAGGVSSLVQGRILSPEKLTPEQKETVNSCLRIAAPSGGPAGVLVSVFKGAADWDLRPMLLDKRAGKSALALLRFTDPALALRPDRLQEARRIHSAVSADPAKYGVIARGEGDGRLWIRRSFYPHTLSEAFALQNPYVPTVSLALFAQKLVGVLLSSHESAIVHGHLTVENVAFDGEEPILIDAGFSGFAHAEGDKAASVAPELLTGAMPAQASDFFGLGQVLRQVLGNGVTPLQAKLIETMLIADPAARPPAGEISRLLLGEARLAQSGQRILSAKGLGVRTGKVIKGEMLRQAQPIAPQKPQYNRQPLPVQPPPQLRELQSPVHREPPRVLPPAASDSNRSIEASPEGKSRLVPAVQGKPGFYALLGLLFVAVVLLGRFGVSGFYESRSEREGEYKALWESNQPSRMREVVQAAVEDGDLSAQDVIVGDALNGANRAGVRNSLLRVAFDSLWEASLSKSDRRLALMLALSGIGQFSAEELPPFGKAHPGVILAAAGSLPVNLARGKFSDVQLAVMTQLPPPYGPAFSQLEKQGISSFDDPVVIALAHLLSGDAAGEVVEAFLGGDLPEVMFMSRLLVLSEVAGAVPGAADMAFDMAMRRGDSFARRVEWFDADTIAGWEKLAREDLLALVAGGIPRNELSFEQYSDLLKYPSMVVRKGAVEKLLLMMPGKSMEGPLAYLAGEDSQLSRFQIVSLLVAVRLDGDPAYSLLARWFSGSPAPDTRSVLQLLLTRSEVTPTDPFSMEASRYLASHEWRASLAQLRELVTHKEPFARALGYSKLSASVPEEAEILKEGGKRESSSKMRDEILRKLSGAQLTEGE